MRNAPPPSHVAQSADKPPPNGMAHGRTIGAGLWTFAASGGQAAAQLGLVAILSRLLPPAVFGQMALAMVVVSFCGLVVQQGLGPALVQSVAIDERAIRTSFTLSLLAGCCLTVLLWQIASLAARLLHMPELAGPLRGAAVVILWQAGSVTAESLLIRALRLKTLAAIDVSSFLVGFGAVAVTLALAGLGVWAIVWAHIAHQALRAVLLLCAAPHAMRPLFDGGAARRLVRTGMGFSLAACASGGAHQVDYLIVGRWLGCGPLGLYERAYQLMTVPARLSSTLYARLLFPVMARHQMRPDVLRLAYRRGLAVTAMAAMPSTVGIFLLAPEIVRTVLGTEWLGVVAPLRILALGMLCRTSYKLSDTLARAAGAAYRRAWRQWSYVVLVLLGTAIGARWGITGAACGVLAAIVVNFLLMAQLSLLLLEWEWSSFYRVHLPALRVTAIVGGLLVPAVEWMRWQEVSDPFVIAGAILLAAAAVAGVARTGNRWLLGDDGLWLVDLVKMLCSDRAVKAAGLSRGGAGSVLGSAPRRHDAAVSRSAPAAHRTTVEGAR